MVNLSLLLFSFVIGLVHAAQPDHWVPLSVVNWQKGLDFRNRVQRITMGTLFHLGFAFVIYYFFQKFLEPRLHEGVFGFSIGVIFLFSVVRVFRFRALNQVIRSGKHSSWGILAAFSILGPAESLVPLLLKANILGASAPLAAAMVCLYGLGTALTLTYFVSVSQKLWERPWGLINGIERSRRTMRLVPVGMLGALVLFLVKI